MNIQKLGFIALCIAIGGAPALANDAHHDAPAAPAATNASAAAPAVPDGATAAKDEAAAKPAPRKMKRKKPRAEAKPAADDQHADAAHADAHATPVPPSIAPTARVRVKDRASAAAAVAAVQASADHGAHDSHAASASAPAADHAAHSSHDAPAAQPASLDAPVAAGSHDAHDAPAVPAPVAPTKRSRVKQRSAAASAPAADAAHATAVAADAHDAPHDQPAEHAQAAAHDDNLAAAQPVVASTQLAPQDAVATAAPDASATSAELCNPPLKSEISALFDRWNASLRSGDPKKVVANYAPDSILLPTVSNRARFTVAEKEDYFMHFLQKRPQGYIDDRLIEVDCNSATDAGLYTFRFADGSSVKARYSFAYKKINGQWLITSHHSSGMPEKPEAPVAHAAEPQQVSKAAPKAAEGDIQNKGWVRFP